SALKQHPEIADLLAELVGEYWPSFKLLGDRTRGRWLTALYHVTFTAKLEARLRPPLLEGAIVSFAKAVEGELRERIFKAAKLALASQGEAKPRKKTLDRSQPADRFVLFVSGRETNLTLGEM